MSIAGKAIVPFEGDFSSLTATADKTVDGIAKKFTGLLGPVGIVGAAVGGVIGFAADLGATFTKSTDQMAANSKETIAQATKIGTAFLKTGGITTETAQEMMDAYAPVSGQIEFLNGKVLTVSQTLGFMKASEDLAEASGAKLATTTSTLADIMTAFDIPLSETAHTADLLFNASTVLGVPLDSLTTSLQRARTAAGAAAPTLQDLSAFVLDLAAHGESGRGAVSLLGTALTGIYAPTKAVREEQDKLGVSFLTAKGQLIPLQQLIAQVSPIIDHMGNAQATATLKALGFGSASSKLVSLMQAGVPAFEKATAAVNTNGSASAAAAKTTDNATGAFDRLKSKVIDAATAFGLRFQPDMTSALNWAATTGIADIEKVGTWVDVHIITPFVHVSSVVLPKFVSALDFAVGHLNGIKGPAIVVGGILAGLWATNKIAGWVGAATSAINKVKSLSIFSGTTGSVESAVKAAASVQKVFVTNYGMIGAAGGGGFSPAVPGAAAGAAAGAAEQASPVIYAGAAVLNQASNAWDVWSHVIPLFSAKQAALTQDAQSIVDAVHHTALGANMSQQEMAALEKAIASGAIYTPQQMDDFIATWKTSTSYGKVTALEMGTIQSLIRDKGADLQTDVILWGNALSSAGVAAGIADQAENSLAAFIKAHGPPTANEIAAFQAAATDSHASADSVAHDTAALSYFVKAHGPLTANELLAFEDTVKAAGGSGGIAEANMATLSAFVSKHGPLTAANLQLFETSMKDSGGNTATVSADMGILSTWLDKHGPLVGSQLAAFEDDINHGVNNAFDIALSLKYINEDLNPGIESAAGISSALDYLHKHIPKTLNLHPGSNLLGDLSGLASGGRITGPSIVGEDGPELYIPDGPGMIIPNGQLRGGAPAAAQLSQFSAPIVLNLYGFDKATAEQVAATVGTVVDQHFNDFADAVQNGRSR